MTTTTRLIADQATGAQATVNQMINLLRALGDLSAYIVAISDSGHITLLSFKSNPVCTTLPPPTGLGESVDSLRLDKALLAVEVLNRAIDNDEDTVYTEPRMACLNPNTWQVDEAMTACVKYLASSHEEPTLAGGTLPRLGPEQVKLLMADLRRLMADLSGYIDRIGQDEVGPVVYLFDDADGNAANPATPTALASKIDKEGLGRAQAAFKLMNSGFREGGFRWDTSSRKLSAAGAT